MGDKSAIEWTDATWNPVTGCTKVSAGCKFCYAERLFPRAYSGRKFTEVRWHAERLDQPLRWKKPRRIFVNSMSDLFHEDVPGAFIGKVFGVMAVARQHVFQVLTKRPQRMSDLLADGVVGPLKGEADQTAFEILRERSTTAEEASRWPGLKWPLPNVWLGVSVEDQATADERIPLLLQTPAAIRFVSYEPALGPIKFSDDWMRCPGGAEYGHGFNRTTVHAGCCEKYPHVNWLIAGGESGPNARSAHPEWIRSARDQCAAAGTAFFFKQWGEWAPGENVTDNSVVHFKVGKHLAGRKLDGREHSEYPI